MNRIKTLAFIVLGASLLSGCALFRTVEPVERVITKTETVYTEVPEDILICPLPPIVDPSTINSESQYNESFVLALYANNLTCYQSIVDVYEFNEILQQLNDTESEVIDTEQ